MAGSLVWHDLSADQLQNIRYPHPKRGKTARDLLATALGIPKQDEKQAISLDLYVHALQFADVENMSDSKTSGLLSIVRAVHLRSTAEVLTQERSFAYCKEELLRHSVQRPPRSVAIFTLPEMQRLLDWMLDSYYRHYKLYQHAFNPRATLNASSRHPMDGVEQPPMLQALVLALTSEEQQALEDAVVARQSEAERAAEELRAAEAEADRLRELREQYEAAVPDEIQERVNAAVARELALLRVTLGAAHLRDVPDGAVPSSPPPASKHKHHKQPAADKAPQE